jgi:hypothetical protein
MQVLATLFFINFACTGNTTSYSGHSTYDYMAFDGDRQWRYQNESESVDYTLIIETLESDSVDGVETITFEYSKEDPQELLGSITWVSGLLEGIGISKYSTASGEEVVFDEVIVFAQNRMVPGGTVSSETNGSVFTATMHGVEECANEWNTSEVWDCLHFTMAVDSDTHSFPFVGDFWMANGWGPSRINIPQGSWGTDGTWVLTYAECSYDGVPC